MATLRHPLGYRVNPGFEAELVASPEYRRALRERAEDAADYARAFAPVDTGDYLASIHVREGIAGLELAADDYKAFWIEFGTGLDAPRPQGGWSPAFAPLRRGLRAAGIELDERFGVSHVRGYTRRSGVRVRPHPRRRRMNVDRGGFAAH